VDLLDFNAQESSKSTENLVLELGLDPDEKTATRKDDHEDFGGFLWRIFALGWPIKVTRFAYFTIHNQ